MMEAALYIIGSAIAGALISWVIATARTQKKCSELENRATSAETLVTERGRQVEIKDAELTSLRAFLPDSIRDRSLTLAYAANHFRVPLVTYERIILTGAHRPDHLCEREGLRAGVHHGPIRGGVRARGDGSAPDYGFIYPLQQEHWTVDWQEYVSEQTVNEVDAILDR
ncbi:MAG: hypothetical protein HGA41_10910, partial [Syntrophaceae bacterium]|nr:hypothetical protein [Syntrophaceae bacterium]